MKKLIACAALAAAATFTLGAPDAEAAKKNCPNGPDYTYVSRDYQECLTTMFICVEGQQFFIEGCGCGCYTGN
jgi:hypothetical protein